MGVPLQHVNLYRLKAALIKWKIILFQHGHFPTFPLATLMAIFLEVIILLLCMSLPQKGFFC